MKKVYTLFIMSSLITSGARAGTVNFDDAKTGAPPPGWTATQTGKGAAKGAAKAAAKAAKPCVKPTDR